jgi:hypothetical protein
MVTGRAALMTFGRTVNDVPTGWNPHLMGLQVSTIKEQVKHSGRWQDQAAASAGSTGQRWPVARMLHNKEVSGFSGCDVPKIHEKNTFTVKFIVLCR